MQVLIDARSLVITLLCLLSVKVSAQPEMWSPRSGFIVLTSGDTLTGLIRDDTSFLRGLRCRFKSHDETVFKQYYPSELKCYKFDGEEYFESKTILVDSIERLVFIQYLVDGIIDVYQYTDYDDSYYYVKRDELPLIKLDYAEGVRVVDGKKYAWRSNEHKRLLKEFVYNDPEFQRKIEGMIRPNEVDLIGLAKDFHLKACGTECSIYVKKSFWEKYFGRKSKKQ